MTNFPSYHLMLIIISLLAFHSYAISPKLQFAMSPSPTPLSPISPPDQSIEPDPETQALIDKICRQMEQYGFCNNMFKDHLPTPHSDIFGLTEITLEQTLDQVVNGLAFIDQLESSEKDPAMLARYAFCSESYNVIDGRFKAANMAFASKDYGSVEGIEKPSAQEEFNCEQQFGGGPNPLRPVNDQTRQLIAMSVVTADLLGQQLN